MDELTNLLNSLKERNNERYKILQQFWKEKDDPIFSLEDFTKPIILNYFLKEYPGFRSYLKKHLK